MKVHQLGTSNSSGAGGKQQFPIDVFYKKWQNLKGQTSFLRWATQAPRDVIDLAQLSREPVLTVAMLQKCPPATKSIVTAWLTQPWNSVELIGILMQLACEEKEDDAK